MSISPRLHPNGVTSRGAARARESAYFARAGSITALHDTRERTRERPRRPPHKHQGEAAPFTDVIKRCIPHGQGGSGLLVA